MPGARRALCRDEVLSIRGKHALGRADRKDTANQTLEKRLWAAADQFQANSGLKVGQYSTPVLGLIFQ